MCGRRRAVLRIRPMLAVLIGIALGLVAGIRHAFEPDHVAAVTSIAAGERKAARVVGFATSWGLGHAVMLVGVGGALFAFRRTMPAAVEDALELGVAAALVALGVRALLIARRDAAVGPVQGHHHGEVTHEHAGPAEHVHVAKRTFARLPFLVGLVHGLSGSGALTALAVSKVMSVGEGLVFMTLYATGALLGMAALAGVAGIQLSRLARRPSVTRGIIAVSGLLSLSVGVAWALPILSRLSE